MLFRAVRNLLGSRPNAHTIETHNNARVLLNLTGPARQETVVAAKPTRNVWTTVGHREPKEERTPGSSEFKFHLTKTIKRLPVNVGVADIVTRPKRASVQDEQRPVEETKAECETCQNERDSA